MFCAPATPATINVSIAAIQFSLTRLSLAPRLAACRTSTSSMRRTFSISGLCMPLPVSCRCVTGRLHNRERENKPLPDSDKRPAVPPHLSRRRVRKSIFPRLNPQSRIHRCDGRIPRSGSARSLRAGQGDQKITARIQLALRPDRPTLRLHHMPRDGQPQPRAARLPRPRFIYPVEPLEDPPQVFRRNPLPEVPSAQLHPVQRLGDLAPAHPH